MNRNISQNRHYLKTLRLSVVPALCLGYTAEKLLA